ncbi:MAG: hypothetical protein ABI432_00590 [Flavobacteriales bacterium]
MDNQYGGAVKVALGAALSSLLFIGCLKQDEFPKEPKVVFKSFEQFGDSSSLTISFTDGDGDVGLDAYDTAPPFDTSSVYYYNLFLEYDYLDNGEWTRVNFPLPLYYRIPRITPTGQNKALEGEIAVAIKPWPILPNDTIRFSVHMVDRALHESNTVVSDAIKVVP